MKDPIELSVWHLDVDLSFPGGAGAPKGSIVHRVKRYMSWVNNVARQLGSYLPAPPTQTAGPPDTVREELST